MFEKLLKKRITIFFVFTSLVVVSILSLGIFMWVIIINSVNSPVLYKKTINSVEATISHPVTNELIEAAKEEKRIKDEAIRKEAEIQDRIARAENLLRSYGSVMVGYGEIIVRQADACGGDYRILLGIAGNESGLGRIPYKLYNPYGYLDGVQYAGWNESLTYLSCVISQRFIAPCAGDLYCIINKYGGPDTDKEKWIRNVTWFMNQV
jgi:hypothetical protein